MTNAIKSKTAFSAHISVGIGGRPRPLKRQEVKCKVSPYLPVCTRSVWFQRGGVGRGIPTGSVGHRADLQENTHTHTHRSLTSGQTKGPKLISPWRRFQTARNKRRKQIWKNVQSPALLVEPPLCHQKLISGPETPPATSVATKPDIFDCCCFMLKPDQT